MLFHCKPVNQQKTSIFALILWEEQRLNRFWSEKRCWNSTFTLCSKKSVLPSLLTYTWRCENITASPCGYMYLFTFIFGGTSKFLGVQSLTLPLGVQRKLTAFSPRKVVHHAVFCKYYAELAKTFFFLSDIGSNRKWGSVWPMAFVSVPPFFCNIVYNLSNFVFYTELNARLPIYGQDH